MTTPAANNNAFLPDVPIQFDLMSQKDIESGGVTSNLSGPPKRINPFDTSATEVLDTLDAAIDNATYVESYVVRFLGSMEVKSDRGEQLIHETMRQILAARAIHNVFKMTESRLVVSSECMRLVDPSNNGIRTQFALSDISFWAAHHENNRLFGFITRNKQPGATLSTFACHVFECNVSADEICQAIGTATKLAFQALMEKKAVEKIRKVKSQEKDILLSNIQQLDDAGEEDEALAGLPLSPDGKYLILTATDDADDVLQSPDITSTAVASAAVSQQPIQQTNNDDDEESESEA
ncbi:hypothetical protein KUTeg_020683 [Tegillarca granosa]|uniref:PID domain-containing protein n=1 Tax=Tegillarca granosa TaxID=220873 RepID=A0ABQ9EBE1_TEGGR|nr:hypothetical protein KUTeg_020683 [Tegillarca granosa]